MSPNFSKHSYNLEEKQNVMVPNIDGITLTFALFGVFGFLWKLCWFCKTKGIQFRDPYANEKQSKEVFPIVEEKRILEFTDMSKLKQMFGNFRPPGLQGKDYNHHFSIERSTLVRML